VKPPEEALHAALRARLPASSGVRLELAGLGGSAVAAPEPGSLEAVLIAGAVGGDEASLSGSLAALRAGLAPGGRLLWAGPPGDSRALRAALAEAGFVIESRDDGGPEDPRVLVARPSPFVVRAYREGDEDQILPLFAASFGTPRSRERWAWAYADCPYGARRISEAFDPEGRLVAHYAGYPAWLHRGGERLPAQHIGDTMTARAVRHLGRGPTSLLGRTVGHFYARFCEGQVAFNYGFNTANIQRFSLRFVGARKVEPVPFRTRAAGGWPRRGLVERLGGGYRVERVTAFDAGFDELFARVLGAYGLLFERDARYLAWRYGSCPGGSYATYAARHRGRLAGWGTFRLEGERLVWGDALFDPAHRAAVARLLERAAAEHPQARTIEGWLTPRPPWWDATLRGLGFETGPEPSDLALMVVPFGWDPEEEFRRGLYYTKGDGDLF